MPYELDLSGDDSEFLPRFDAHLMHGASALRAYLLFFGKPVFHRLHREIREHGLATTLVLAALVGDLLYSGLGQKGIGYYLGFIEKPRLIGIGPLAGSSKTVLLGQAELFLIPLDLGSQFSNQLP
jgi:hypothetical protein